MHGPFMDMAPGSPDQQINEVCKGRFRHALRIAHDLGVQIVVLHANFIAAIHTDEYRIGWQQRNVTFWEQIADYAAQLDVTVAVENMWEFDPDIIGDVLKTIDHPNLRACIDIGHAHLYSEVPFTTLAGNAASRISFTCTSTTTTAKMDFHRRACRRRSRLRSACSIRCARCRHQPSITLEMDSVADMEASLRYFQLAEQDQVGSD